MENQTNLMVANANQGITNIIDNEVVSKDLMKVFDRIFQILSDHYGPHSKYAMIVNPSNVLGEPVHTKDGINILSDVEFISPMENIIKHVICHVGKAIEASSGDGTTSSMMLVCAMLKHLIQHIQEGQELYRQKTKRSMFSWISDLRPVSDRLRQHPLNSLPYEALPKFTYDDLKEAFNMAVDMIQEDYISYNADTENNNNNRSVYDVAFWQAYSSSHGDIDVAKAVADMFGNTPKDCWQYMSFMRSKFETDTPIKLEQSRGQFEIENTIAFSKFGYNQEFGSWFKSVPKTKIFLLNDSLQPESPGQQPLWHALETESEGPVIVIARAGNAHDAYKTLDTLHRQHRGRIMVFLIKTLPQYNDINDIVAIGASIGADCVTALQDGILLPESTTVEFQNNMLYLNGLFSCGKDRMNENLKTSPMTQQFVQAVNNLIRIMENDSQEQDREKISEYRRLVNRVIMGKQYMLTIGGLTYDNVGLYDVVMDAVSSVRITLQNGYAFGGNKSLFEATNRMRSRIKSTRRYTKLIYQTYDIQHRLRDIIIDSLYAALLDIGEVALRNSGIADMTSEEYMSCVMNLVSKESYYPLERPMNGFLSAAKVLIIQPANVDIDILRRFGEVALKYVMTERIITKNAAYLKSGTKE